jgi:hypothetical protein
MKILEYTITRSQHDQYQSSLHHAVSEHTTLRGLHQKLISEGWTLISKATPDPLPEGLENIWGLIADEVNPKRIYGRVEHRSVYDETGYFDESTGKWILSFDERIELDAEYMGVWW